MRDPFSLKFTYDQEKETLTVWLWQSAAVLLETPGVC